MYILCPGKENPEEYVWPGAREGDRETENKMNGTDDIREQNVSPETIGGREDSTGWRRSTKTESTFTLDNGQEPERKKYLFTPFEIGNRRGKASRRAESLNGGSGDSELFRA